MSEIYAALAAVMADCKSVAKRDRNEHQRFLFRGIDAVVNAVGPILREHGVIVVPSVQTVTYEEVKTSTGKPATACRVVADYVFYATDGSNITTTVAAEAWDNGDKAAPKAMSVAFRTALLQALALPTDEPDPDHHVYEQTQRQDPMTQAKHAVAAAWRESHGGAFDAEAMREDYEHTYSLPLADADAHQLHDYASHLLATTTTNTNQEG